MPDMKRSHAEFEQMIARTWRWRQYNQLERHRPRASSASAGIWPRTGNQNPQHPVAALKHQFRPESQQLGEFGVKPRVFRRKKKGRKPKPPTVTPAPTPGTETVP